MDGETLAISGLEVAIPTRGGFLKAVRGVDLRVGKGETVALVGESGCGKTLTALSILSLVPKPAKITGGSIFLDGVDAGALDNNGLGALRGRGAGMVFQEPMTSLNPVFTVGFQLAEAVNPLGKMAKGEVRARSVELLREVGIPEPEKRLAAYPHELSGGLRQRVMIACAIAQNPPLVIADEPTTALDVTVEAQVMELFADLAQKRRISLLLITHDLGVVERYADRVYVMYSGLVVEEGSAESVFTKPAHPYTKGLLRSIPRRGEPLTPIRGTVPPLCGELSACPFAPRCDFVSKTCLEGVPQLLEGENGRKCRCVRGFADV